MSVSQCVSCFKQENMIWEWSDHKPVTQPIPLRSLVFHSSETKSLCGLSLKNISRARLSQKIEIARSPNTGPGFFWSDFYSLFFFWLFLSFFSDLLFTATTSTSNDSHSLYLLILFLKSAAATFYCNSFCHSCRLATVNNYHHGDCHCYFCSSSDIIYIYIIDIIWCYLMVHCVILCILY